MSSQSSHLGIEIKMSYLRQMVCRNCSAYSCLHKGVALEIDPRYMPRLELCDVSSPNVFCAVLMELMSLSLFESQELKLFLYCLARNDIERHQAKYFLLGMHLLCRNRLCFFCCIEIHVESI